MWGSFPTIQRISWADGLVGVFIFALLYLLVRLTAEMNVPFSIQDEPHISLAWQSLPYYAARSLLRMFIAFFFSLLFTFIYGRTAARYKFAQKIMLPILDILQSIPVLGFLSATVTAFMALFPHSLLGLECASIFAIFTGQAWNMTFSFYQSVSTIPRELQEASNMVRLDAYARFTRLELPYSMIGLVWNSMLSFGGGWFFLAASESLSVDNHTVELPGIGSYIYTAINEGNVRAVVLGVITMMLLIVLVDQLFWRPIVAWSQKFKMDFSGSDDAPKSWFLQILRRSRLAEWVSTQVFGAAFRAIDQLMLRLAKREPTPVLRRPWTRAVRRTVLWCVFCALCVVVAVYGAMGVVEIVHLGLQDILHIVWLGALTMLRVMTSTFIAILWTVPVGILIGLNPKASRIAQPLIQMAASFPTNTLYPLVTMIFVAVGISFQIGAVPLMMLGTQWYILFSVIAGAMAIPNDLKEATRVLGLRGWERWKHLLLPSVFPYLVTGCMTASGGAWNASILAEFVVWKSKVHAASGLGAFLDETAAAHHWANFIVALIVMSAFVVLINHFVWRPMFRLAEKRYHFD
ncbi:ABC transporter permease subunit [Alicyclobacillus cycloheptanicus]|nr:ABC transporter permease subunit [Alicyclobacillus cycloheptanicus]WDM02980.1 ABC transporter permease subunit [Alicyclobacillus cycloheptanicus]